jgi:hypothetical protein
MDATEQRGVTERRTNACLRMAGAHSGRWARVTSSRSQNSQLHCVYRLSEGRRLVRYVDY